MTRRCARPSCTQAARATLSYAYDDRMVWIEELATEAHPMTHDLCDEHAASLNVPKGWECRDRRIPAAAERPLFAAAQIPA